MTENETLAVLGTLRVAYPQFYKDLDGNDIARAVKLWCEMFADDDAKTVTAAVKAFIATDNKGYPPSIGIIKNRVDDLTAPEFLSEYDAWNILRKAINGSDYIWGAEEEFEKLPDDLKAFVHSPSWLVQQARLPEASLETVVGSNFMRSYKARAAHFKDYRMLPEEVKKFAEALAKKRTLVSPEIKDEAQALAESERRLQEIASVLTAANEK